MSFNFKGVTKLPPNQNQKGNHYITFKIKIPKILDHQQKQIWEEIAKQESPIKEEY